MKDSNETKYGYFGWKEFLENRKELLDEYDRALGKNSNRPVRTSHGIAGEAIIRKWLSDFLPQKYGVTSGYIIPDIICSSYKLFHYDIIIYDKINSPVLWIDGNYDDSIQGKKRAIPAKYIFSILEIKATFSNKAAKEAIDKLSELNSLSEHLPQEFSSGIIFFEIKNGVLNKPQILNNFLVKSPFKFWGGMIIRSELNNEMTGLLQMNYFETKDKDPKGLNLPLAKDIESLDIYKDTKGGIVVKGQGAGIIASTGHDKEYHFNKTYSSIKRIDHLGVSLSWSYNYFSQFIIYLLKFIEGESIKTNDKAVFGQVFDIIQIKKDE